MMLSVNCDPSLVTRQCNSQELYGARSTGCLGAIAPPRLNAQASNLSLHEPRFEFGGRANDPDIAHMFMLAALAPDLWFASDHLLGWRNPRMRATRQDAGNGALTIQLVSYE